MHHTRRLTCYLMKFSSICAYIDNHKTSKENDNNINQILLDNFKILHSTQWKERLKILEAFVIQEK